MFSLLSRNKVGNITNDMLEQLGSHYAMDESELNGLRFVTRPGKFSGAKATYIRVFDPTLLEKGVSLVKRYDDLALQAAAILFEGRIAGGKFVYLNDRRMPT